MPRSIGHRPRSCPAPISERRTRTGLTCAVLALRERCEGLSQKLTPDADGPDAGAAIVVVGEFLVDVERQLWLVGLRQLNPEEYPNATVADARALFHHAQAGAEQSVTQLRRTFPAKSAVRATGWLTLPRPSETSTTEPQPHGPRGAVFHPVAAASALPVEDGLVVTDDRGSIVLDQRQAALWRRIAGGTPSWQAAEEIGTTGLADATHLLAHIARWHERGLIARGPQQESTAAVPGRRGRVRSVDWNVRAYYRYLDVVISVRFPSHESLRLVAPAMRSMRCASASSAAAEISIAPSADRWLVRAQEGFEHVAPWHQLPSVVRAGVLLLGQKLRTGPAIPASLIRSRDRTLVVIAAPALGAHICEAWVRAGRAVEADRVIALGGDGRALTTPLCGWELPNDYGWVASDRPWGTARPLVGLSGQLTNFWHPPADRQTPLGSWRPNAVAVAQEGSGGPRIRSESALAVTRRVVEGSDQVLRRADLAAMIALLGSTRCVTVTGEADALAGWARSGARLPPAQHAER